MGKWDTEKEVKACMCLGPNMYSLRYHFVWVTKYRDKVLGGEVGKRYWGQYMWARGYFVGSLGAVTEEMIKGYVENQSDDEHETFKVS